MEKAQRKRKILQLHLASLKEYSDISDMNKKSYLFCPTNDEYSPELIQLSPPSF